MNSVSSMPLLIELQVRHVNIDPLMRASLAALRGTRHTIMDLVAVTPILMQHKDVDIAAHMASIWRNCEYGPSYPGIQVIPVHLSMNGMSCVGLSCPQHNKSMMFAGWLLEPEQLSKHPKMQVCKALPVQWLCVPASSRVLPFRTAEAGLMLRFDLRMQGMQQLAMRLSTAPGSTAVYMPVPATPKQWLALRKAEAVRTADLRQHSAYARWPQQLSSAAVC